MNGDAFLEQFGSAAPYLRMSEQEKFKLMGETKLNAGKKYVWVPKTDTAYEKGLLKEIKDGTAYIQRLCDDKEVKMKEDVMMEEQMNPSKFGELEDIGHIKWPI